MLQKVISGVLKGMKISSPKGDGVRPTSARVRESLFNILQASINESNFLDAFSGTGSVGLEALSRGAGKVYFLESDQPTYKELCNNVDSAKVRLEKNKEIEAGELHTFRNSFFSDSLIKSLENLFDIVWVDPPYLMYENHARQIVDNSLRLAKSSGVIVFEMDIKAKVLLEPILNDENLFESVDYKKYGKTFLAVIYPKEKSEQ